MTLPGIWGVERFGRRRLLLIGAAGMATCEFIVAIVGVTVSVSNLAGQRVLIAFVCIYIVSSSHDSTKTITDAWSGRPSSQPPGVPLRGSSPVKSFLCKCVRRLCLSPSPATGYGTSVSVMRVRIILL